MSKKPFRDAGITKEEILAKMEESGNPWILAKAKKLRALKSWTVDQLHEVLCDMLGKDPKDLQK